MDFNPVAEIRKIQRVSNIVFLVSVPELNTIRENATEVLLPEDIS
jgi:hypothetical protein